ncbi:uncharacterized protein BDR25DRAFT_391747 [Lindgomyces ingoldianus]|uniref:Uncharacterized protein n=1 Tax=Lindgomyces ingoldianus TaxID=673940 RepID=A0ACB6R6J2_9PLEO|nr:uncharacterized protein BDR25DRAFT_391747 [Lindgomyces ingoldianus]KAF2474692.1 hypothetical protein BDR25DRAFT_391747 [Lindgomyces ingoldianus]
MEHEQSQTGWITSREPISCCVWGRQPNPSLAGPPITGLTDALSECHCERFLGTPPCLGQMDRFAFSHIWLPWPPWLSCHDDATGVCHPPSCLLIAIDSDCLPNTLYTTHHCDLTLSSNSSLIVINCLAVVVSKCSYRARPGANFTPHNHDKSLAVLPHALHWPPQTLLQFRQFSFSLQHGVPSLRNPSQTCHWLDLIFLSVPCEIAERHLHPAPRRNPPIHFHFPMEPSAITHSPILSSRSLPAQQYMSTVRCEGIVNQFPTQKLHHPESRMRSTLQPIYWLGVECSMQARCPSCPKQAAATAACHPASGLPISRSTGTPPYPADFVRPNTITHNEQFVRFANTSSASSMQRSMLHEANKLIVSRLRIDCSCVQYHALEAVLARAAPRGMLTSLMRDHRSNCFWQQATTNTLHLLLRRRFDGLYAPPLVGKANSCLYLTSVRGPYDFFLPTLGFDLPAVHHSRG